MFGIDISKHQSGIDLTKFDFDFAMIKATEGITYTDPCFEGFVKTVQSMGKLFGVYHYARPDNHSTKEEMMEEAEHFINTIQKLGLIKRAILILDWEQQPTSRFDLMKCWLETVRVNTGITPFIYASNSLIQANLSDFYGYPAWNAKWPSIEKISHPADIGWIEKHFPMPAVIWQYTSNGRVPGWNDRIDLNYTPLTETEWNMYAGFEAIPSAEKISDDMQWAIDNGIFTGYPDGKYRPMEPLTRQAAATILRRLVNIIAPF